MERWRGAVSTWTPAASSRGLHGVGVTRRKPGRIRLISSRPDEPSPCARSVPGAVAEAKRTRCRRAIDRGDLQRLPGAAGARGLAASTAAPGQLRRLPPQVRPPLARPGQRPRRERGGPVGDARRTGGGGRGHPPRGRPGRAGGPAHRPGLQRLPHPRKKFGQGGMGSVYLAVREADQRRVVVKFLAAGRP